MLEKLLNTLNATFLNIGFSFSTFLICVLIVVLYILNTRRKPGIPPGPPLIPILGNLLKLASGDLDKTVESLRPVYGDVFSLYIGQELLIVLNGYKAIHAALVQNGRQFANRPQSKFQKLLMDITGVLYSNGQVWKEQRQFTQKAMKEICYSEGGRGIETVLQEETKYVLEELDALEKNVDIRHFINVYSLNVIFRVIYGHRFSFKDKMALYLIDAFHDIGVEVTKLQVTLNCFPFLQKLPGDILGVKRIKSMTEELTAIGRSFDKPQDNDNSELRYVDMYDDEIKRAAKNEKAVGESFTEIRKNHTCMDMIGAASDTTANAIAWILLYLVREPQVQDAIFKEITQVVDSSIQPGLDDRKALPYTEACIMEGLRISSSAPFALPHSVAEDTYLQNFLIPKHCTVLMNLTSVLKDPDIFKDPDVFRPERFLTADKSDLVVPDEFVPFSIGPRSCLGESLARMEIFMIISGIILRYKLLPGGQGSLPQTEGELSTVYKPLPFTVDLVKRP